MITATIYLNEHHDYRGFDISGHAGFSESGSDIVCAAASMLVINTLNALERYTEDETSCVTREDEGEIEFRFKGRPSHDASLLIKTMVLGLESMKDSREYKPYIDVIFREV